MAYGRVNVSKKVVEAKEYGLQWAQGTDTLTRIDDAETLNQADFNNIAPWKDIKRCVLNDNGTVNYYLDASDSDLKDDGVTASVLDGTDGQVMVEIPMFWYKSEKVGTTYKWWISDRYLAGFQLHPAFIRNGKSKSKIYFGAFEGFFNSTTNKMESRADAVPSTNDGVSGSGLSPITAYGASAGTNAGDIRNCRVHAQARGTGWEQRDFLTTSAIQLLYLVEYADFDSQTTIGLGVTGKSGSNNDSNKTGATVFLGNASGREAGTNNLSSVSYRGIENFWGNIWEWCDGINLNDYEAFVSNHGFESDKFISPYSSVGTVLSTSNTYIKDILYNGIDYGFLASEGGADENSYLHDNWWVANGECVFLCGGSWNAGSLAGAFCWISAYASSIAGRFNGSRLLYVP